MKHPAQITLVLLLLFFTAQVVGLGVINQYIDHKATDESVLNGTIAVQFQPLPYNLERPPIEEKSSFIYLLMAILIGTGLLFLIIRFKKVNLWKTWFFLSVLIALSFAFSAFMNHLIAFWLAFILAIYKVFRPNFFIHNITELFIYSGIAAIFVPVMNLFSAVMMLLLISVYDAYAVWKSKHMVKMAKFQAKTNVFAGLFLRYPEKKSQEKKKKVLKKARIAVLGGGDIAFPLLFAGVVMKGLMLQNSILAGFSKALIIPVFTTIALALLFYKSQKGKFYPAMPFLSTGCFVGYGVLLIVNMI